MPKLPPLKPAQADALASRIVRHCQDARVLPAAQGEVDALWPVFHRQRTCLKPHMNIPMTSLTPLLARVLFAVGALAKPYRVAVLGMYAGNLMSWLTAAGFGPLASYRGGTALGVDVDVEAVQLARANLGSAGYTRLDLRAADAYGTGAFAGSGPYDALLIDVDEPVARKCGYLRLLQAWRPMLAPGSLVLAHDVVHPVFAADLAEYTAYVAGPACAASTTLPVDECGVSLSVLADDSPTPEAEGDHR